MKEFKDRGINDDLDIDTLLTVLFNRINSLLIVFLGSIFILSLIYIFQERIYQSNSLLQFENNSSFNTTDFQGFSSLNDTQLSAEIEIFKSLSTIQGAKNKLNSSLNEDTPSLQDISSGLTFSDDGKNLLTIRYSNNNSNITQSILSSLIDEFLSDRAENNRITAVKGIEFVDKEIPKLRLQLDLAEEELTKFKTSGGKNLIFGDENSGESIKALNEEIQEIELKEIELKEFYKPTHPIYSTLIEQKKVLLNELSILESDIKGLPSDQRKLFNLTQRVNIYSSSLEELEKQKLSLSLTAASSSSNVRIINYPSEPIKISPRITLILFSFVVLVVAYSFFLLNHFFTDKIMSLDALVDYIEDRNLLIGAFPFISGNSDKKILNEIEKNFTDRVVVNILNSDKKVYLISSMKEGVGKSYFSEKLINKLSNFSEKTCLIDLDLRKKGISNTSKTFKEEGIDVEDYLNNNMENSSTVLIKKPLTDDPLKYLNSDKLFTLINSLKADFDKIIIDSPPMGTFIDAKIISNYVDQIICILSSHESSFSEISSMTKELKPSANEDEEILFFLNKVRYFLEIFWFNVRYPVYGSYNYYNPYNYYYAENSSKSFRKVEKYVLFALKIIKKYFEKVKLIFSDFFKRNK